MVSVFFCVCQIVWNFNYSVVGTLFKSSLGFFVLVFNLYPLSLSVSISQ